MKKPYKTPTVRDLTAEEIERVRPITKLVPKTIGCLNQRTNKYVPHARVVRIEAYPPGSSDRPLNAPIRKDVWCVEITTDVGVRYYGFAFARINSRLRMEVTLLPGQEHDEVLMKWENAE